jgi:hypothetical protein
LSAILGAVATLASILLIALAAHIIIQTAKEAQ